MLIIAGYIVIVISVFGGFALAGGHVASLWQPVELLMIGGGALGAFVVGNSMKAIKATVKQLPGVFKESPYTKATYMDLMSLLYEVLTKMRKDGMMSIEADLEDPEESAIFQKYPAIVRDHHIIEFITDYLRLMVGGSLNPMEIEKGLKYLRVNVSRVYTSI